MWKPLSPLLLLLAFSLSMQPRLQAESSAPLPTPLSPKAVTTDWPSLLGPNHAPVSPETHLLRDWGTNGPTRLWSTAKGESYASPVVVSNRVYSFHRDGDEECLDALDALTGRRIWRFAYPTAYEDRYGYNGGPRAAPYVENGRVFTYGAEGKLHAVDAATGKKIWSRDLSTEYKVKQNFFGVGAAPVVYRDEVIINLGSPEGIGILAMDVATGSNRWTVANDWGASYSAPVIKRMRGADKLLVFAGGDTRPPVGGLISVDLATHKKEFEFPFRCERYESVNAASPVVWKDDIFLSFSIRDNGCMIRTTNTEAAAAAEKRWHTESLGAYWMTPVIHEGNVYGIGGEKTRDARIICIDAETGKERWSEMPSWKENLTVQGEAREMSFTIGRGFLLRVDGGWLCIGEFGHLCWLDLDPEKGVTILKRAWLFKADNTWCMPVVSRGLLYVPQHRKGMIDREPTALHCFDLRAP